MSEPLTNTVLAVIEDSPGATVDEILTECEGHTRVQVLTSLSALTTAGRARCARQGGKGRGGGSLPGRYYAEVSIRDQIIQHLEENREATPQDMATAFGMEPRQVMCALTDLCAQNKVHVSGMLQVGTRGRPPSLYRLGCKPGWLPNPLPVNSVFALGAMA